MQTSILKPGLLVSLKTAIRGGIAYSRVDLEADHITAEGERVARWETRRAIADPDDHERAVIARSKARAAITAACCASGFGLLCPIAREADLADAIEAARAIAEAHNRTATSTRVDVYVLAGRIAQNDAEAARAIAGEMRDLLGDMQAGIAAADPERIREAASKAKAVGAMLTPETAGKVSEAIVQARAAARAIVARVSKAGETAAAVVAELQVQKISAARFAFLDMGEAAQVQPEAPAGRGIDFDPPPPAAIAAAPATLNLEF